MSLEFYAHEEKIQTGDIDNLSENLFRIQNLENIPKKDWNELSSRQGKMDSVLYCFSKYL